MQLPSLMWFITRLGGIYLLLLGSVFGFLGVADFSVADDVPNPSKMSVLSSAIAIIIAIIFTLRLDALTIEKDVWEEKTNVIPENPNQDAEQVNDSDGNNPSNRGCIGISSVFIKIFGTVIYLLLFPFQFTKLGEWIYQIQWSIFTTLEGWSSFLPIILAFLCLMSYSFQRSFIHYVWLLGRIFFLGVLFTNQVLFQYTIIPTIIGSYMQLFYQFLRLSYKNSN